MALSHLIKYVYNTGSDEVIRRGKKIHAVGFVELVEHDELLNNAVFRVKDDTYSTYYKVNIQKYTDPKSMSLRCSCPYNLGDICRHEAAALFQLQELIDKNMLGATGGAYSQRHTVAKMKHIDLKTIRMLSSPEIYEAAEAILETQKATIASAANERVEAELDIDEEVFHVVIQKTMSAILILPVNAMKALTPFVCIKQSYSCSSSGNMVLTILTPSVTGTRKKINCCRYMVTTWKMT